jgi:methyltransferase (TIGR00027 family)
MVQPSKKTTLPWLTPSTETPSLEQINAEISAMGCALMRYVESNKPVGERMFCDPLAGLFLTEEYKDKYGARDAEGLQSRWLLWLGALRERFIDEMINATVQCGLRQLVLLGSGYDTRVLRMKSLRDQEILVFEIDQDFMIQKKKEKLLQEVHHLPPHLRLVSMDFHRDEFEVLLRTGFNPEKKSLLVAQALSYYIDTFAMEQILKFVASRCRGSRKLVFDFVDFETMKYMGGAAVSGGSYWNSLIGSQPFCMQPEYMNPYLTQLGFKEIASESLRAIEKRYTGTVTLPVEGWYVAVCAIP